MSKTNSTTGNNTKTTASVNTYWMTWAKAAAIRAVKTFFQVFASLITVDGLATGIEDVNWIRIASVAAVSGVYSIATSFAGLPEVSKDLGNGATGDAESSKGETEPDDSEEKGEDKNGGAK